MTVHVVHQEALCVFVNVVVKYYGCIIIYRKCRCDVFIECFHFVKQFTSVLHYNRHVKLSQYNVSLLC